MATSLCSRLSEVALDKLEGLTEEQIHRHTSAIELDHEKSNHATMMGIRVLRFTNRQVLSGQAKRFFEENGKRLNNARFERGNEHGQNTGFRVSLTRSTCCP
jgi:hypothetical protein